MELNTCISLPHFSSLSLIPTLPFLSLYPICLSLPSLVLSYPPLLLGAVSQQTSRGPATHLWLKRGRRITSDTTAGVERETVPVGKPVGSKHFYYRLSHCSPDCHPPPLHTQNHTHSTRSSPRESHKRLTVTQTRTPRLSWFSGVVVGGCAPPPLVALRWGTEVEEWPWGNGNGWLAASLSETAAYVTDGPPLLG